MDKTFNLCSKDDFKDRFGVKVEFDGKVCWFYNMKNELTYFEVSTLNDLPVGGVREKVLNSLIMRV